MSTCIAETADAEFAEATTEVGQLTVALLPGEAMVTPVEDDFAETRCTSTEEAPIESDTVAVTR
jgi:hypothetical protein